MKKIILMNQKLNSITNVTHGLENIRNYAMTQTDLRDVIDIEILSPEPTCAAEELTNLIAEKKPDMVGLSTYVWTVLDTLALAEGIKKRLPGVKIILGGPQVSDTHWDIMTFTPFVDGIVRGEGEVTFCELLRAWMKSSNVRHSDITGYSYRDETGCTVHNQCRPPVRDMDRFPYRFKDYRVDENLIYGLETIRGCYNRCGYCSIGSMPFRKHSVAYILKEIDYMADAGMKTIVILDSSFTFDPRRTELIARRLADRGIRYICCAVAEEIDEAIMDILLETGAIKIEFGLQTSNPDALKLMKRRFDKDLYERNIHLLMKKCEKKEVEIGIDVICGLPGDNLETFCQSIDFVYHLKPHNISAFPLHLFPGTDFYINHERYGFRFIPYTQEFMHIRHRYNMHQYGLVLENFSFPEKELIIGRHICLFNGLLKDARYTSSIYSILEQRGITFSQLFNSVDQYLPENFYEIVETINDSAEKKRIRSNLYDALRTAFAK